MAGLDRLPATAAHLHSIVHAEAVKPTDMEQLIINLYQVAHTGAELEISRLEVAGFPQYINYEHVTRE